MKKYFNILILFAMALFVFASCQKETILTDQEIERSLKFEAEEQGDIYADDESFESRGDDERPIHDDSDDFEYYHGGDNTGDQDDIDGINDDDEDDIEDDDDTINDDDEDDIEDDEVDAVGNSPRLGSDKIKKHSFDNNQK